MHTLNQKIVKISFPPMLTCTNKSVLLLLLLKFNFHFCPTCLKALCYAENSLSRSRVKVKVVWWCWGNVNELHICHMELEETIQMLWDYCTEDFSKKIWMIISFFSRRDRDFYNLIVRDEIEICIFYISRFETRSRNCSVKSWISRRGREIKKNFSWSSENSRS